MQKQYIYPQNMKAAATLWLWSLRDFLIMVVLALFAAGAYATIKSFVPAVAAMLFAFLTIRNDNTTILDFIKYSARYFLLSQQEFKWGLPPGKEVQNVKK
ncbi:MAG: hypothetical protein LUH82_07895 [Clostridiales bacterium]|nr:hypothetical protein [Clostridiales bacterium]